MTYTYRIMHYRHGEYRAHMDEATANEILNFLNEDVRPGVFYIERRLEGPWERLDSEEEE